jgi:hypothetical protein
MRHPEACEERSGTEEGGREREREGTFSKARIISKTLTPIPVPTLKTWYPGGWRAMKLCRGMMSEEEEEGGQREGDRPECGDMSRCKIHHLKREGGEESERGAAERGPFTHMNVISDPCAVRGLIIVTKDRELGSLAHRHLQSLRWETEWGGGLYKTCARYGMRLFGIPDGFSPILPEGWAPMGLK